MTNLIVKLDQFVLLLMTLLCSRFQAMVISFSKTEVGTPKGKWKCFVKIMLVIW